MKVRCPISENSDTKTRNVRVHYVVALTLALQRFKLPVGQTVFGHAFSGQRLGNKLDEIECCPVQQKDTVKTAIIKLIGQVFGGNAPVQSG